MTRVRRTDHAILLIALVVFVGPLALLAIGAASPGALRGGWAHPLDGMRANVASLERLMGAGPTLYEMTLASLRMALSVAFLATGVGFLAAYAMTHFAGPRIGWAFWLTLLTLYFPIEARMLATFDVAASLGMIDTLAGLVLPILPLAIATFFLRQHLLSLPRELTEAARLDGAGPLRYLIEIVLPLSILPLATVFVICFILGWNQYLWPLMISVDNSEFPLMRGFGLAGSGTGPSMVIATVAIGPPLILMSLHVLLLNRQSR